jgi:uncharacterized iron-regulated membrane protein
MRTLLTQIHRWAGLVVGLLLVALGISGSALVFRADIERWQAAAYRSVNFLPDVRTVDDWVAAAKAYAPRKVLARITLPENARDTAQVFMRLAAARNLKQSELGVVYVDPYRATALGSKPANNGVFVWLRALAVVALAQSGAGSAIGTLTHFAFEGDARYRKLDGDLSIRGLVEPSAGP